MANDFRTTVGMPTVYRDLDGDHAATVTYVYSPDREEDGIGHDDPMTVDLKVFRRGLPSVDVSRVSYTLTEYGGWRNIGDTWDDQSAPEPGTPGYQTPLTAGAISEYAQPGQQPVPVPVPEQ